MANYNEGRRSAVDDSRDRIMQDLNVIVFFGRNLTSSNKNLPFPSWTGDHRKHSAEQARMDSGPSSLHVGKLINCLSLVDNRSKATPILHTYTDGLKVVTRIRTPTTSLFHAFLRIATQR